MLLLHPQIEPWLVRGEHGCRVALLCKYARPSLVQLRCEPDNEARYLDMKPAGRDGALYRFEADLPWDSGNENTVYCFKLVAEGRQYWLSGDGVGARLPHREQMFRIHPSQTPPAWVREQVFYQIFPDRFRQGDPALQVQDDEYPYGSGRQRVIAKPWGAPVDPAHAATAFYGGDLIGVRDALDYLQRELGVTALYLNPIFTSGSNHKYDTEDYYNVDPHMGGNTALAELSAALHGRGMRLMLDAVVNHTAINHPWFNLHGRHAAAGAAQSADSTWRSWYSFDAAGEYIGWNGHKSLPVLDFACPAVQDVVYRSDNAILRHWMRPPYAIDGWRFDVIHMLGEGTGAWNNATYARAFRQTLREENPAAYFIGEHFAEATRWLQGDQEDGAMNYFGFAQPVREWLAGIDIGYQPTHLDTADFAAWLDAARGRIPYDNQLAQLNLLDSHDTARFFTLLGTDVAAMKLAVTLQFSWPGTPCIYYGDEIGLEGGNDPDCRRCFDWDPSHWHQDLYAHYRSRIALRQQRPELSAGACQVLYAKGDVFAFARYTASSVCVFALNRGTDEARLKLPLAALPLAVREWQNPHGTVLDGTDAICIPARDAVTLLGRI